MEPSKLKNAKIAIYTVSIVVPVLVAVLFKVDLRHLADLSFLPPIYAGINALTAILLVAALVAIKKKNIELHRKLIRVCLLLSLLFLGCYVAYHMTSESTAYAGAYKAVYIPILVSHILLSVAVIPMVLFTYLFAWQGDYERHKKWTRFTFPIWLYVAVSGVIVYWMIAPFYGA